MLFRKTCAAVRFHKRLTTGRPCIVRRRSNPGVTAFRFGRAHLGAPGRRKRRSPERAAKSEERGPAVRPALLCFDALLRSALLFCSHVVLS